MHMFGNRVGTPKGERRGLGRISVPLDVWSSSARFRVGFVRVFQCSSSFLFNHNLTCYSPVSSLLSYYSQARGDFRTCKHFTRNYPHLIKLVIPHNGTSIQGEPSSCSCLGVHFSNTGLMVRFVFKCDGVDDIIGSQKLPISIQKYFFPGIVIEADVSQKGVKLVWRTKPIKEERTNGGREIVRVEYLSPERLSFGCAASICNHSIKHPFV